MTPLDTLPRDSRLRDARLLHEATKYIEFINPLKARKAINPSIVPKKLQPSIITVYRRLLERYIYVLLRCSVSILIIKNIEPLVNRKIVEGLVISVSKAYS